MDKKLFFKYVGAFLITSVVFCGINSCTKLDEVPYSSITANQFLTSRNSVILDFIRSFEHGYWSIQGNDIFAAEEDASDELMTPNRRGDWLNGNYFFR